MQNPIPLLTTLWIFLLYSLLILPVYAHPSSPSSQPSHPTSSRVVRVTKPPSLPHPLHLLTPAQRDLRIIQERLSFSRSQLKKQQLAQAQSSLAQAEKLWILWVTRYAKPLYLTHPHTLSVRQNLDRIKHQLHRAFRNEQAYTKLQCPQSTEHFPDQDNELYLEIKNLPEQFRTKHISQKHALVRLQNWRIFQPITQHYHRQQRHLQEIAHVEGCFWISHAPPVKKHRCYRVHGIYHRYSVAAHWSLWKLSKLRDIVKVPCRANP